MAEEKKPSSMPVDWDKDKFPTSAKPVYQALGILTAILLVLCAYLYLTSEDPSELERVQKREQLEAQYLTDDQLPPVDVP